MGYILERTALGFCWWDLPAFLILVGVCVYSYTNIRKMKEQEKALEERLTATGSEDAVHSEFEVQA